MLIRNEFAVVEVNLDESANGPRLCIRDVRTGASIYLDPLELEALTRRSHQDLTQLVNPAYGSVREEEMDLPDH